MMRDFDKRFAKAQRRHDMMFRFVMVWFAVVLLLIVGGWTFGAYVAANPELIGEYAGKIKAGFEAAS